MNIEAVTVCIGYADFLAETIRQNVGVLDRWIIVTSPDDKATREICRRYSLQALLSEDAGEGFNKGKLVERGLHHTSADGWRLHLDADVQLPQTFRHSLRAADLDMRYIYGCDRVMVPDWDTWVKVRDTWQAHDYHCRVNPPAGLPIGSRWCSAEHGYVPIGFFQLWHSSQDLHHGARIRPYPTRHNDACRSDVQHGLQWDRKFRALIPELLVIHLESEKAPLGANWEGRTTKAFGPDRTESFGALIG